jgi:hypothetical protein
LTSFVLPLKQGIVLFWAVWLSVTFFANTFDGLKALKVMGEGWRFVSGNYASMVETTRKYPLPAWFAGLLFLGVVLWQGCRRCSSGMPSALSTACTSQDSGRLTWPFW